MAGNHKCIHTPSGSGPLLGPVCTWGLPGSSLWQICAEALVWIHIYHFSMHAQCLPHESCGHSHPMSPDVRVHLCPPHHCWALQEGWTMEGRHALKGGDAAACPGLVQHGRQRAKVPGRPHGASTTWFRSRCTAATLSGGCFCQSISC